jgi:lipid II:glycine glycyltransferase (peptidoglycan interpeptide bridge formation enzyme)
LTVYTFNPLGDPRWAEFSQQHPGASVFHTTGWLEALHRTYGFEPIVYTTSPPGAMLTNGMVFCRISSWLTGRRMVSLPFADHCEPLVENPEQLKEVFGSLQRTLEEKKLKYIEIRPRSVDLPDEPCMQKSNLFCFHVLDLRPTLEDLFRQFQRKSIRGMIRRAEREALCYEEGCSEALLNKFYHLLLLTRRRHKLPPQPIEWFQNLIIFLPGQLTIRVASYRQRPIASILTLSHGDTLVYKYSCSDARYHNLGGNPFLLWRAVQEAKERGMQVFDFGRSNTTDRGLIRFKDNWGSRRSMLVYGRICAQHRHEMGREYLIHFAKRIFVHLPDGPLTAAGRLLYRHIA